MKQCPQCKQTYSDDSLNFCLSDGAVLSSFEDSSEEATVIKPLSVRSNSQTARRGVSPLFAYLTVGLVALFIGGAAFAWMKSDSNALLNSGNDSLKNTAKESVSPSGNENTAPVFGQKKEPTSAKKDTFALESEIKNALDGWTQTLVNRDFEGHLNYYADRLDTYYKRNNADISFVRNENSKLFEKYSTFDVNISNLKIDVDSENRQAVTVFDSTFNFRGGKASHSGVSQAEFRWKKINGMWKITSERTLKTYRTKK